MIKDREDALKSLSIVKDAIEYSKSNRYWVEFATSMGPLFFISGLMIIGATILTNYMRSIGSNWGPIAWMWGGAILLMGIIKMFLIKNLSKREGISFFTYFKKVTPPEFWQFDVPLELTGLIGIIFCIKIGQPVYILPVILLMSGHFFNSVGVLFKTKIFMYFGYIWIILGTVSLFWLMSYPLIIVGAVYGGSMLLFGLALILTYKNEITTEESSDEQ